MSHALVARDTKAVTAQAQTRAAQYVRMSTDYQRYSIENQAAVIATYAQVHGLKIVRTYSDEGRSGLRLKSRIGLIQLLEDVQSGQTDFRHILVYDVSRWGRFQDTDESAHYEFICKKAGLKVAYCAEQFNNDGTMLSSILKNLKRVMAAEYSRDLSAKVHAGALRFSRMGFRTAGEVSYGLRRQFIDEKSRPKAVLQRGDRKYLMTDHVRVVPGPADETAVVRWIFQEFLKGTYEWAIARELNRNGTPTNTGRPWNGPMIGRMLRNECYIGNLIYNRRSGKLREKRVKNPPPLWVRCEGCIEPIIAHAIYLRVQKIIRERRVSLSDEETLKRLRITLMKRGRLSPKIIDAAVNAGLANELAARFQERGRKTAIDSECLVVDGLANVSFRVARWMHDSHPWHAPYWTVERKKLTPGWVVAIRLAAQNKALLDYLLLPSSLVTGQTLRFTETGRIRLTIDRFEHFSSLSRSLVRRSASLYAARKTAK